MTFTVQTLADDPAHGLGDDVGHLQANRLDGPLPLGSDVPAGRLDDAAGPLPGLLPRPPPHPPRGPAPLLAGLPRPRPRPQDTLPGRPRAHFPPLAPSVPLVPPA